MSRHNLHATAVVLGKAGLLIIGPSGAGKSTLALALLQNARDEGRFAAFVADDQVWLRASNGRLVAEAPDTIAGLAEYNGFGPAPVTSIAFAVIDAVVHLVDGASAPRFATERTETLQGIVLPRIDLARRNLPGTAQALTAWMARSAV